MPMYTVLLIMLMSVLLTLSGSCCEARDSELTQFVDDNQISGMRDMLCTK